MNPYYRCFEAADGFLAVACLNLAQRRAFLELFGLEDRDDRGTGPRAGRRRGCSRGSSADRCGRAGDRGCQPVEVWLAPLRGRRHSRGARALA